MDDEKQGPESGTFQAGGTGEAGAHWEEVTVPQVHLTRLEYCI